MEHMLEGRTMPELVHLQYILISDGARTGFASVEQVPDAGRVRGALAYNRILPVVHVLM